MTVLQDSAIAQALQTDPPLATNIDANDIGRKTSQVQPASLDLTIGEIFVPGTGPGKLGSYNSPRDEVNLPHGGTAVIRTKEELHLPNNLAGIGFPPSSVSLKGLLMTNPGHVDPGFKGTMSFTVINMGKETYRLAAGDPIVTLLFIDLGAVPSVPYNLLKSPKNAPAGGINERLLELLSADFMDIEKRSERRARKAVRNAQITVPIVAAICAALLTFGGTIAATWIDPWKKDINQVNAELSKVNTKVNRLDARLSAVGADINLGSLEGRLTKIEEQIETLER